MMCCEVTIVDVLKLNLASFDCSIPPFHVNQCGKSTALSHNNALSLKKVESLDEKP